MVRDGIVEKPSFFKICSVRESFATGPSIEEKEKKPFNRDPETGKTGRDCCDCGVVV